MSELTPKQSLFVQEYLKDLNATQAAIRAGYSESSAKVIGCENLTKPYIQDAVYLAMKERMDKVKIDAGWVLNQAVTLHERCMQSRPVLDREGKSVMVETPDGDMAPAYTFDSSGANKSLETVGKHVDVQAFLTKHEHSGKDGAPIEIESVGETELARRVAYLLTAGIDQIAH